MENFSENQNNHHQEMSIWELLSTIWHNWLVVAIILAVFLTLGSIYAFVINEDSTTTYYIEEKVIYHEYEYYPIDFVDVYISDLKSHLKEKLGNSYISSISIKDKTPDDEFRDYVLTAYYSTNLTQDDVKVLTDEIQQWHNDTLYNQFLSLISQNEQALNRAFAEYSTKQEEYFNYLNDENGYYDTQSKIDKYRSLISTYQIELEQLSAIAFKVTHGFPLLESESNYDGLIITELNEQTDFLNEKIDKNQVLLNETNESFNVMVITEGIYKSERDVSLNSWETLKSNLNNLYYEFSSVRFYYVKDFNLKSKTTISTWKTDLAISLILGFVIAIIFVLGKESFNDYKHNKKKN